MFLKWINRFCSSKTWRSKHKTLGKLLLAAQQNSCKNKPQNTWNTFPPMLAWLWPPVEWAPEANAPPRPPVPILPKCPGSDTILDLMWPRYIYIFGNWIYIYLESFPKGPRPPYPKGPGLYTFLDLMLWPAFRDWSWELCDISNIENWFSSYNQ